MVEDIVTGTNAFIECRDNGHGLVYHGRGGVLRVYVNSKLSSEE